MTLQELRKEIDEITRIFQTTKYYEVDFRQISTLRYENVSVYNTFYLFIERIFFASSNLMVIGFCKMLDNKEKYSLFRLKNKVIEGYESSELNSLVPKEELTALYKSIETERVKSIFSKIKTTRDKYYAHLDRTKPDFSEIIITGTETLELILSIENVIKTFEQRYFDQSVSYDLTSAEMGYKLFDRLNEWERYREKFGLLKD